MKIETSISIHDNLLLSYEVSPQKEIIFKTLFKDKSPVEYTDIIFSGVVAYQFTDDAFEAGTILNEIVEIDLEKFVSEYAELFKDSYNHWIASENALAQLQEKHLHNFAISTSLGMYGWVLCNTYRLVSRI